MSVSATAAFLAGVLSFLSPCVLPLIPAYLAYMSGVEVADLMASDNLKSMKRTGLKSLLFVLGFSVVFIAMGAAATSVANFFRQRLCSLAKSPV